MWNDLFGNASAKTVGSGAKPTVGTGLTVCGKSQLCGSDPVAMIVSDKVKCH